MVQLEHVIEKLNMLFSMGDYENAEKLIESARKVPELYNDTVAIFDANLAMNRGDAPRMWQAIKRGLENNPKNYELYVMLGEYYLNTNPNQAYLCFENALLYCDNETDYAQIQELIKTLKTENDITVNNVSFIILSYNTLDYTKTCIESIRENTLESSREIVIVDNASTDGSLEWLKEQNDIVLRANKENSGFPKGCNQGVEVAQKENDIFLFNNDTLLPPNALFWLRMGLYENDTVGATGSITNYASNLQSVRFENPSVENMLNFALKTNTPLEYPYEEKLHLVGFALLIKRPVYNRVGDLDERFSPGNYEDNDYGLRILQAGYKNILCKNSFIIHFGSKSFGKKVDAFRDILSINAKKFEDKWGVSPSYYFAPRPDLINLVTEDTYKKINVLEIGCGCGATSTYLKGRFPLANTFGVELVPEAANIAKCVMNTICANIEDLEFPWEEDFFDYVIMGDVLEHLREPSTVLKRLYKYIKKGGHIIISMPNMKHFSVMIPLIMNDEFTYTNAGILDTTHLKMYTRTEIIRLVQNSGYSLEHIHPIIVNTQSEQTAAFVKALTQLSINQDSEQYLAYQYIIKANK